MDRGTSIRLKILILFMVSIGSAIFMEYQTIWAFSILMIIYYVALTLMDKCYSQILKIPSKEEENEN